MEILILGQLLNLVTNLTKVKIRRLEKLHKYLITNAYDIIFNRTCINERLLPNFAYIYIYFPLAMMKRAGYPRHSAWH